MMGLRHLGTASGFLHEAKALREVVLPPETAHDKDHYAACWGAAIEEVIVRLRLDFEMEEKKTPL